MSESQIPDGNADQKVWRSMRSAQGHGKVLNRRRPLRLFLLAGFLAAGVACGGQDGPTLEGGTTTSVAKASGNPGERYLAAVNPVNCIVDELEQLERQASLGDGSFDPSVLPQMQGIWAKLASARRTAVRVLLNESWPSDVDAEIRELAGVWAQAAERHQALADAYDLGAYNLIIQNFTNNPLAETNPGLIRALLNLGSSQETNRC
jgi:hypothetical protein